MKTSFVVAFIAAALSVPGVALADGCSDGSSLGGKVGYAVGMGQYTPPAGMTDDQLAAAYASKQADLAGMKGDARTSYIQSFTNCWKGDYSQSFQQGYLKNPSLQKTFQSSQKSAQSSQSRSTTLHNIEASVLNHPAIIGGVVVGGAIGAYVGGIPGAAIGAVVGGVVAGVGPVLWTHAIAPAGKWLYNEGGKLVGGIGGFFSNEWKGLMAWRSKQTAPVDPMAGAPGFNGPIGSSTHTAVAVAPTAQPGSSSSAASPAVVHVQGQTISIEGVGVTR